MGKVSTTITSEVMVAVVVILFLVFVIIFFFYLHKKRYHGAMGMPSTSPVQFILAPVLPGHPRPHRALNPTVLRSLPATVFDAAKEDTVRECSVCISEVCNGEEVRLLPSCGHGFHVECIDMWFGSNNTCPLCRTLVSGTRVLGKDGEGSSGGKREEMLVIEIPGRMEVLGSAGEASPVALSRAPMASPMSARLKALRRMLSGRGSMKEDGECSVSTASTVGVGVV